LKLSTKKVGALAVTGSQLSPSSFTRTTTSALASTYSLKGWTRGRGREAGAKAKRRRWNGRGKS